MDLLEVTVPRRRSVSIFGGVTAAASFLAFVGGLVVLDDRVRVQLGRLLNGRAPNGEIADMSENLQQLLAVVSQAVADQSVEHAPLVVFGVAAIVLVLFMTRT